MQCLQCGFDNPTEMKFCGECGAPVKQRCLRCGFDNPLRFNFCGQCGAALSQAPAPTEAPPQQPEVKLSPEPAQPIHLAGSRAERRQLTVMFCDLVGSTTLAERLDPEELRELFLAYQQTCVEVINRFEGYLAQYLGDGLLVYFGYPVAHEDDPRRAVQAGLSIVAAMEQLNQRLQPATDPRLAVRVGIHTGLVVVGEIGVGDRREQLALGEPINLAARLQDLTLANTVAISAITYQLIQDFFVCQDLGSPTLKGFSQPLQIYQVLRKRPHSRLKRARSHPLSPLIGRDQEGGLLLARWEQAKNGQGQVILLGGEAGIGKSRLVQLLKSRIAAEPYLWLESRCSAYYQHSAFYPLIELLQRLLWFRRTDSPAKKLDKLERALAQAGLPVAEMLPLFAGLLSLPLADRYPPLDLTPQRQKQKTLEALLAVVRQLAAQQPVVVVMEDLHWVDPSTLELLHLLVDQGPTMPVLTLFTFRPQFSPPWTSRSYLTQFTLDRLAHKQARLMIERLAGGKTLPPGVLQQIILKTDGVPLFVEELTKMVLEMGLLEERADHYELSGSLPPLAIPATLHDSLMARLDRLATVREVAQLGATLGREFSYELLQAISPLDELTLQHDLARLVEAELLYQHGLPPQATYSFKHALIQETAYNSLLRSKRQQYHQQIAQVLAERFPETVETQPELLAHHYTMASLSWPAIGYWQQAGERAIARSANLEAITHLTQAVELLMTLPDTPERTSLELTLQISLGVPLLMTRGYASPAVERTYARARELAQHVGETPQLFSALFGLWVFYLVRAELQTAQALSEQLTHVAHSLQDAALLLEARQVEGITLFYLGELTTAQTHLEQVIAAYDPWQAHSHASYGGADLGVTCLAHAALALWLQGYPDQALQRSHAALALARELSQPFSLAFALCLVAWLHQYRREREVCQELAEAAISLSSEQGFALSAAFGAVFRSWALADQTPGEIGIVQLHRALAGYQATGAELERLHFLSLLVEAHRQIGQIEEGDVVLAEALGLMQRNGERFYEAELYRLKGELFLKAEAEAEAEACFQQALKTARHRQTKSLELRAAISLSRLWQRQGRSAAAYPMLAEVYGWFTEGFDTADLQEARALLVELEGERSSVMRDA